MTSMRAFAVLASVLILPACGSSPSGGGQSGAGRTLTVLMGANTVFPDEQRQWFADVSGRFEKQTGAKVTFETFASPNDELTRIQTSVLSGQGPDLYALGTTFTPTAYATKAFVELTKEDWDKVGGRDRFLPATLGISGPDAQHEVGIPFATRPFVLAYNKELLAKAGIDKPADSWDGLGEQARKLTGGGGYGLAIGYADTFDPWKFVWAMSVQAGNPLVDGGKARLQDPTTQTAYRTYLGWLATDKVVDPAAVGWKNAQAIAAFGAGRAAMLPMVSASSRVSLDKSAVAGKYAYTVMPTIPPGANSVPSNGKAATSILSGDNLVVASYSRNRDLALSLVNLLTSAESQRDYYEKFGELPTNAGEAATLRADPTLAALVESAGKSVGTPFTGAWSQIQLALVNVVVQSVPDLSAGNLDLARLDSLIAGAQSTAQAALDKAK
jgi:multiple sugar transport system substrate-binding protein